jgi:hypothetical protein
MSGRDGGETIACRLKHKFWKGGNSMPVLRDLLPDLAVDKPAEYQNVRIHPLRCGNSSNLDYLTLEDDTVNQSVTLEETSGGGTVSRLQVRNRSPQRVFVLDGTTLVGSKQNRVVNLSLLLAPESVTIIPVSCLERGRWRYTSHKFNHSWPCDVRLRSKMCSGTTASLKRFKQVQVDQAEVWAHVDNMLGAAGASSPTIAYHAAYAQWDEKLCDYQAHLSLPQDASGVAVEVDGGLEALDLFDKAETLRKLWPQLVRSYSMAAINSQATRGRSRSCQDFLEAALAAPLDAFEPVGIGTTARLETEAVTGAALLFEGRKVHLSLFPKGESTAAPRPWQARDIRVITPESGRSQPRRRRPWWKFWS